MLSIIVLNVLLVVCAYVAYQLVKRFFADDQKILRILVAIVLFVLLFGGVQAIHKTLFSGVNVDKELQKDPVFMALKKKHPQEYQSIVNDLEKKLEEKNMDSTTMVAFGQQRMTPIIAELVADASDDTRQQFATAFSDMMYSLKVRDETLCYDAVFNLQALTKEDVMVMRDVYKQNGMDKVFLAAINDNGVDKAVVSEMQLQKTAEQIMQQLYRKHGDKLQFLIDPTSARTPQQKQSYCELTIEFYKAINDPNDKAKKALLRQLLEDMATEQNSLPNQGG